MQVQSVFMSGVRFVLLLGLSLLQETNSQRVPDSPCPSVFKYERDYSGWYGVITAPNPLPFLAIELKVSLYIKDRVPSTNKAKLSLVDSNAWQNLAAGDRRPVLYRLDFPLPYPIPTIKDIVDNEEEICSGVKPSSPILTTLTIEHSIYNDKCSSSSLQCPFNIQGSGGKPPSGPPPSNPTQDLSSAAQSPCPEYFAYQRDGFGSWYGLISIPNPYPIVAIDLRVSIYLTDFAPQGNKGGLQLVNNLRDEWQRMRTGEKYSVPYKLTFPLQSPLPTIKSITANNRLLCTGNKPVSSRLQTFAFQHGLFHEKCSSSSLDCPYNTVDTGYPVTPVQTPPPPTQAPPPPPTQPPPPPPTKRPTIRPRPTPQIPTGSDFKCGNPTVRPNFLVFYGQPTVRGQWPWHTALYHLEARGTRIYKCGGSFIGTRSILTAAHCVTAPDGTTLEAKKILVFLGKYDLRERREAGEQEIDVRDVLVHDEYTAGSVQADLAILILAQSVNITEFVRPVCLWNERDIVLESIVGKEGMVAGWGLDEGDNTEEVLKMVKMPIVDQLTCDRSLPSFFPLFTSDKTLCAGYKNGSSVCNGDSGGGLVLSEQQSDGSVIWKLRGIVSISKPRDNISRVCDTKNYIIFTDAAKYLNWINSIYV